MAFYKRVSYLLDVASLSLVVADLFEYTEAVS